MNKTRILTSKPPESSTCKESHAKFFITKNFTAKLSPGAMKSRQSFESVFSSFSAVFALKFLHMDQSRILLNKTLRRALTRWGFTLTIEWQAL